MPNLKLTLRTRIYLSMLAIIILSLVATGMTAYWNYKKGNKRYHEKRLLRKEEAITRSLDYFLEQQGGFIHPDSVTTVFSEKICELSDIHNLPFILFDLDGKQMISSDPAIFDKMGIPEEIDYTILKQLSTGNNRAVSMKQEGDESLMLAYWYYTDEDGKPIAINNVPYSESDSEDPNEVQAFLSDLLVPFIILFIGAAVLGYFLSNYITRSLQAISSKLQTIELGKKNEPLEWSSNDEIGALVNEYNRMLDEVERSANLLAKSERESAWREMAKQVAHEIKNPLTPMKLRVQHLVRTWEDGKREGFGEKLESTTQSLIEQIDSLSNIANEFSNFAQMPKAKNEKFELEGAIQTSIELFQESKNVHITYHSEITEPSLVMADKEQVIRLFNNLIKNAIQAMPSDRQGLIDIHLKSNATSWLVEVLDNGEGIPEDQKQKIFVPNFTTKSTGMGLGLAMVKSIAQNAGGDVWFRSEEGSGSAFYVKIPKV